MCPYLPAVDRIWRASEMQPFRENRNELFYVAALSFAQSLLMEGKPAQALLQINKSFLADLKDEPVLLDHPPAYQAIRWILEENQEGSEFLGNPVRHFQHLASRMSGPRAVVRSWRAWGCFHLAERVLKNFPRDEEQIKQESLQIPECSQVLTQIKQQGWVGESDVLRGTLDN